MQQHEVSRRIFTFWQKLEDVASGGNKKMVKKKKKGQSEKKKTDFIASYLQTI